MLIPPVWIFSLVFYCFKKIYFKIKKQQKPTSLLFFYCFNSIAFAVISVQKYCVE